MTNLEDTRPPVVIKLHVEGFGDSADHEVEIDRTEWESMRPVDRLDLCGELAEDHATNHIGWGWYIDDPDDYASTEERA